MAQKSPENNKAEEDALPETEAERQLRFSRNCRHFIDYINHDWDSDKQWLEFKDKNMKEITSPKEIEQVKREYFRLNVNGRLDTSFTLENEEEKEDFIEMCKYVGSILSIGQIFRLQASFVP